MTLNQQKVPFPVHLSLSALILTTLTACGDLRDEKNPGTDEEEPDVISAFLHEDQGDGSFVTVVDAQDEEAWLFLDLETRDELPTSEATDSELWDLAFQRFRIRTNGGTSGSGGVMAARLDADFDDVVAAPADGWVEDDENAPGIDNDPAYAFHTGPGWYRYDFASHRLTPNDGTWVVRTAEGNHFKIQMLAYYDDAGTPGMVSFRWAAVDGPENDR